MEQKDQIQLPHHLSGNQAMGLIQDEPIAQFELGNGRNFVYLLLDWNAPFGSRKAAVVDPQTDLVPLQKALIDHGFQLEQILLTHTHYDHIAGVKPLLDQYPHLLVFVGEPDLHRLPDAVRIHPGLKTLENEQKFNLGSIQIQAFHTPGHSAGGFCFYVRSGRSYLFTGDLIFVRDCGRTDFPDGSDAQMFDSIQRIKAFPRETVLLVGHHYAMECATTLQRELVESPPFLCHSIEELARL